MPTRHEAVQQVAAMVQSAKTILDQAQKISDDHGLHFDFQYTDNYRARNSNGWDHSGCVIDNDYYGWDSSSC